MASALKKSPDPQAAERLSNHRTHDRKATKQASEPEFRPRAIRTVGELAARAGLEQEPVVRKWQDLIREAVAEQDPEKQLQRWDQRRSISVLTLMSLLFWGTVVAAAFGIL